MKININEVSEVVNLLLKELKENINKNEVEVDEDYYWFVNKDELYNPYENPKNLTLGQLSEDWDELKSVLRKEKKLISYDLVKLSVLMRVIGDKTIW